MKNLLIIFLLFWSSIAFANDAEYQRGLDAYNAGSYKKAFAIWETLAKQGNVSAQYNLGFMYDEGKGVGRKPIYAYVWFSIAGANGNVRAQNAIEHIARKLNPNKLQEAQQLAVLCVSSNYTSCQ